MTHLKRLVPITLMLATLSACEQSKSRNPLSPLIAGPIAGVEITTPVLLEPTAGQKFKPDELPVTLLIENPSSNSERPYSFVIEVAPDAAFTTMVYAKSGVTPGTTNGRTSLLLPDSLDIGKTYYWRVKAEDGANSSAFTAAVAFELLEPVVIGKPTPISPAASVRVTTRRPSLTVANAKSSGPHGTLTYVFEASLDAGFFSRVILEETSPGAGQTTMQFPGDLAIDTLYYWRVRVTNGEVMGDWSPTVSFRTPLPVFVPGGSCASSSGDAIVKCIEGKYPSYLAAGVSASERDANMEFLRDRVIEAGICGGLDLAWNKKRGTGPHSIDALAWRTGGTVEVVDIGLAFDDTSSPLRLQWGIVAGPPGYDTYQPRPTCGG